MTTTIESAKALTADDMRDAEQVKRANASGKTPAVFIHGLWLLPSSWDRWAAVFDEAGYSALAPGWPDDPETVAEANADPEVFAGKSVGDVADHLDAVVRTLDRKPVIIGHSFGGLLTQILAGRGLAAASVAIDPAPFRGVLPLPISALRSASPVLTNPVNYNRAVPLTYEQFRYGFANAVGEAEAHRAVRDVRGPGTGQAPLPGGLGQPQSVDRGQGRQHEPGSRSTPDHLRREGQHRPPLDLQRLLQAPEAERGCDRVRRDGRPRPRARDRRRLARGRRHRARLRQAVRLTI